METFRGQTVDEIQEIGDTEDRREDIRDGRQETGEWGLETGDGRRETGDERQETGNGRHETGDRRQEKGDMKREMEEAVRGGTRGDSRPLKCWELGKSLHNFVASPDKKFFQDPDTPSQVFFDFTSSTR